MGGLPRSCPRGLFLRVLRVREKWQEARRSPLPALLGEVSWGHLSGDRRGPGALLPNAAGYKETNNPRPPGWGSSSRVSSVMGHGPRFAVTEPRLRDLAEKRWSRSRFGLHLAACSEPSSRACQQSLPEVRVPGSRLTPSLLAFDPLRAVSKAFIQHQLCPVPGASLTGGDTEGGEDSRQVGSRVRLQPGGSSGRRFPSGAWRGSLPPPDGRRGLAAVPVQPSCRAPDLHGPREGSQPACCLGRLQLRDFSEAQHLLLFDGLVQSRA